MSNPSAPSYDLVIQTRHNSDGKNYWYWTGSPMAEISGIHRRLKRQQNMYGEKLLAWRIVLMQLDQVTGEVVFSTVEEHRA